jgi:hypothetical protein
MSAANSRRDFLKAAAGFMLAPTLMLDKAIAAPDPTPFGLPPKLYGLNVVIEPVYSEGSLIAFRHTVTMIGDSKKVLGERFFKYTPPEFAILRDIQISIE